VQVKQNKNMKRADNVSTDLASENVWLVHINGIFSSSFLFSFNYEIIDNTTLTRFWLFCVFFFFSISRKCHRDSVVLVRLRFPLITWLKIAFFNCFFNCVFLFFYIFNVIY
jgi:hypothetical protein